MDKVLNYSDQIFELITSDFNEIQNANTKIEFLIWNEIPPEFQHSYYLNEQKIDPNEMSFENWNLRRAKRLNPEYSVAIINNEVVASIYSGEIVNNRIVNLWHTNENHRNQNLGKGVLLNSIKNIFENNQNIPIFAWDITSEKVDNVLTRYGFE